MITEPDWLGILDRAILCLVVVSMTVGAVAVADSYLNPPLKPKFVPTSAWAPGSAKAFRPPMMPYFTPKQMAAIQRADRLAAPDD